jgi:uncharacterized protein (TIGR02246 family)
MKSKSKLPMSQLFIALRVAGEQPHASTGAHMNDDERQIRELITTWLAASKAGDAEKVLSLVTDDVVFLVHGEPPMFKQEFAAASRAHAGASRPEIDGSCEIQELKVIGDWGFMWTKLRVKVTPPGGQPMTRAGYTLTIVHKQDGRWRLARDANMLLQVPE